MKENVYKCYYCGKDFHTNKEPKKAASEDSQFIGYICKDCLEKRKEQILKKIICSKCKSSLKEVKPYHITTEVDLDNYIWVKMDYVCPNCSTNTSVKSKIGGTGYLEINSIMLERYEDESIKKINDFYKKGFKIIEKQLQSKKKQDKYKIILAKGNEIKEFEFLEVTYEFSYFWAQIQFVYDKNYKRIPILIEPNKYWSKSVFPQKFDDVLIKISGYKFAEFEIFDFPKEKTQNPLFRFSISLENEANKNFLKVDFREPLSFYKKDQLMFKGYIITLMKGYKSLVVISQGLSGELVADKINISVKSKNERYLEFMAFLLDFIEKPYQIAGLDSETREFDIIIPIIGLNISDKLEIGDCCIIDKLPANEFFKESNFPQKGNFAYLSLNRTSFYNALIDGIKFIQGTIDLINFRIKIPTFLEYYHYFDQRADIKIGDIVYLIDKKHEIELIFLLPINQAPEYKKEDLIQKFFEPIIEISNNLIKPNEELTNEKEKLLWVLHYLMSAERKTNKIEAFLDLFISFEFTLNRFGEKIKKEFSKSEIRELRDYCETYLPIKLEELKTSFKEARIKEKKYQKRKERYDLIHKRLIQLINSNFNQPSINDKLYSLLRKYNLELSEKEKEFFGTVRQKRNDIIHGRESVKPTKQEYNILSKIIYFIVRNALLNDFK